MVSLGLSGLSLQIWCFQSLCLSSPHCIINQASHQRSHIRTAYADPTQPFCFWGCSPGFLVPMSVVATLGLGSRWIVGELVCPSHGSWPEVGFNLLTHPVLSLHSQMWILTSWKNVSCSCGQSYFRDRESLCAMLMAVLVLLFDQMKASLR